MEQYEAPTEAYRTPAAESPAPTVEHPELSGLGGWLILVGIGTVVAPFRLMLLVGVTYVPLFQDGTYEALTTVGSEFYQPVWAPLLIGEIAFNVGMILASFYLIYLFFGKKRLFPSFFIGIMVVSLIFIPLDAWLVSMVLPGEPMFDPDTATEFGRTVVGAAIWIPYMLVSKRVKSTFVNP